MNQQELHIKETLPALSFNYDQLKEWAHGLTARYADMVVTEDSVADVKRDMAELNKNKAKLETARKEIVRRLSEPLRAFETQIKEICGIFDETYSRLGDQVKGFENAQREQKRKDVEGLIIEANMNNFGNPAALDIPIQEKWLNKTTSWKTIREDLAAIVQRHFDDLKQKQALEQARQDRAASIENYVKTLNREYGYDLPLALFIGDSFLDASVSISDVFKRIAHYFTLEKEKLERQAQKEASTTAAVSQQKAPAAAPATKPVPDPAQTRAMSIVLEYDVNNEARIKACLENLKPLCAKFGARYR